MSKISDTQAILLSTASQRENGSIYPLPETLTAGANLAKSISALLEKGFAEECETSDPTTVHRTDGDIRFGVFATTAGLAAIGIGETQLDQEASGNSVGKPFVPHKANKAGAVLELVQREGGATLSELIELTGWLPHTTRAALTGLRKKGHVIERFKRDDQTCYRIVSVG